MVSITMNNLSMKYEKKYILDNLDLEINEGELLVLLGESGCGKTSLLKIIAGIIQPENGTIHFDESDITHIASKKRNVGYVPQAQVLFPHMKIKDNIAFGMESHKFSKDEINDRITWIAELMQIEDLLERYPSEISGGQKQRVAIGRALAVDPEVLLLDEPLSSIDASGREALALTIRRIQRDQKVTTIYVTHNQEEARLIGDRVAIMYNGKVQQVGSVLDVDKHPLNYLIAKIMGTANIYPVEYMKETKEGKKIVTTIGEILLSETSDRKITGINLPPVFVKILDEKEIEHDSQNLIKFVVTIKSLIEKDEETVRLVTEIVNYKLEYLKADVKKNTLPKNVEPNNQIVMGIRKEAIRLL